VAVVIGSRQGPGRALGTTQGAEVKSNPEACDPQNPQNPQNPQGAPAFRGADAMSAPVNCMAISPRVRGNEISPHSPPRGRGFARRPSRRRSRPLRRLLVARRGSWLVSAAAAANVELPIMARCRTRILGPAATIRRRSKHAIHGAASVAMSADGLIATPMFINSSGSPGSWPSWATDARYLLMNLRRHQETSNTFPESDNLLTWRTGPS
jgi:hypothetical protein